MHQKAFLYLSVYLCTSNNSRTTEWVLMKYDTGEILVLIMLIENIHHCIFCMQLGSVCWKYLIKIDIHALKEWEKLFFYSMAIRQHHSIFEKSWLNNTASLNSTSHAFLGVTTSPLFHTSFLCSSHSYLLLHMAIHMTLASCVNHTLCWTEGFLSEMDHRGIFSYLYCLSKGILYGNSFTSFWIILLSEGVENDVLWISQECASTIEHIQCFLVFCPDNLSCYQPQSQSF
jgi:hypothetical protein